MVFKLHKVAITGSISSGKSTVRQFLKDLGAYTVDADQVLHQAFTIDNPIGQKLIGLFGREIIKGNALERAAIARIVMTSSDALSTLEEICHPYVNSMILKEYEKAKLLKEQSLFVVEIPLLFESKHSLQNWFDTIVLVTADRKKAEERYCNKGKPKEQFSFLEEHQLSQMDKLPLADIVVENNSDLETIKQKVRVLFDVLVSKSS